MLNLRLEEVKGYDGGLTSKVYVKLVKVKNEVVLAICDEDILGKTFEDKEKGLKIEVKEVFYKGFKMELEDSISLFEKASIINLVGEKIVGKAVKKGFIKPSGIIWIAGIPHAQLIKMR